MRKHGLFLAVRHFVLRNNVKFSRRYLSAISDTNEEKTEAQNAADTMIYVKPQSSTIRLMLGISAVNLYAWSAVLFNFYMFEGQVVAGIDLSGSDPAIGYVGTAATLLIGWITRYFAHRAVYRLFVSPDEKFIIIQTHTLLGFPGKKLQIPTGNATFIRPLAVFLSQSEKKMFGTSYLPVKVDGISGNFLVEPSGFLNIKSPLLALLEKGSVYVDPKENRVNWRIKKGKPKGFGKD